VLLSGSDVVDQLLLPRRSSKPGIRRDLSRFGVTPARTAAGGARPGSRRTSVDAVCRARPAGLADRANRCDGEHRTAEHQEEADCTQSQKAAGGRQRRDADADDEQYQPYREHRHALYEAKAARLMPIAAAEGRGEFRVLGLQSTLDLVEQPLLTLGKGA
jgi:hypothetical protein